MANKVVGEISDDLLHCAICMGRFTSPRMLPCIHSFCEHCLEKYVAQLGKKSFPCPTCRKEIDMPEGGVKGLPLNFYLRNLDEKLSILERLTGNNTQKCEQCKKGNVEAFCEDCSSSICKDCYAFHSSWEMFKDHKAVPISMLKETVSRRQIHLTKEPRCQQHKSEFLRFYCNTCKKLICRDCTIVEHRQPDHDCVEASTLGKEMKRKLCELITQYHLILSQCTGIIKSEETAEQVVKADADHLEKSIRDATYAKISRMEKLLQKEMLMAIQEVRETQIYKMSHIKSALDDSYIYQERVKNSKEVTSNLLEEDNIWEILSIGNTVCDAFNALQHDLIKLSLDDSMKQLGQGFYVDESCDVHVGKVYNKLEYLHLKFLPDQRLLLVVLDKMSNTIKIAKPSLNNLVLTSMVFFPAYKWPSKIASKDSVAVTSSDRYVYVGIGRNVAVIKMSDGNLVRQVTLSDNQFNDQNARISSISYSHSSNRLCIANDTTVNIAISQSSKCQFYSNISVPAILVPISQTLFSGTGSLIFSSNSCVFFTTTCQGKCGRLVSSPPDFPLAKPHILCATREKDLVCRDTFPSKGQIMNGVYQEVNCASKRIKFSWFVVWVKKSISNVEKLLWGITEYTSDKNNDVVSIVKHNARIHVPTCIHAQPSPTSGGMDLIVGHSNGLTRFTRGPLTNTQIPVEYKLIREFGMKGDQC